MSPEEIGTINDLLRKSHEPVFWLIAWGFVGMGVLLDIISCAWICDRVIQGQGPSGVPVVSLLFYWGAIGISVYPLFFTKWIDFALFTAFHGLCQFGIPAAVYQARKYFKAE